MSPETDTFEYCQMKDRWWGREFKEKVKPYLQDYLPDTQRNWVRRSADFLEEMRPNNFIFQLHPDDEYEAAMRVIAKLHGGYRPRSENNRCDSPVHPIDIKIPHKILVGIHEIIRPRLTKLFWNTAIEKRLLELGQTCDDMVEIVEETDDDRAHAMYERYDLRYRALFDTHEWFQQQSKLKDKKERS